MATLDQGQRAQLRRQIAVAEQIVRRRLWLRRSVVIMALGLVALLADAAIGVSFARAGLGRVQQALADATGGGLAQPGRLATLYGQFSAAQADFGRAHATLWPLSPFLARLGAIPDIGPPAASVEPLLASAGCLTGAAAQATAVANGVFSHAARPSAAAVPAALAALSAQRPAIATAQADIACAIAARKAVDPRLDGAPDRFGPALAQLDAALRQADSDVTLLALAPPAADALLGVDRPRRYLVLGQDPFELRATGGFIGGMGVVTVANGTITATDYRGALGFEPPNAPPLTPPAPLVKYMGLGGWYLRDANYSPDFPTAARQVEAFFKADQGIAPDGVVAVDLYAVQDILAAVGPVTVPGYAGTVSADTLLPQLWQNINAEGDVTSVREQDKTDYLTALVGVLIQKLQRPDAAALPHLLAAVATAVQQRHLLLYSDDSTVESVATLAGAGGAVWNGPGDGLQVVDTQVSYGKMAAMVDESLALDVTIAPNGLVSDEKLTITYANKYTERAPERVWRELHSELFDWRTGAYANAPGVMATFVRVLTPPGTALTDVQGGDDLPGYATTAGRSELSSYLVLRPDQQRSLVFRYVPPVVGVAVGTYRLHIAKQPGTVAEPLTVRLHLPPAPGNAAPPSGWALAAPAIWQRQLTLDQDRSLSVDWSRG